MRWVPLVSKQLNSGRAHAQRIERSLCADKVCTQRAPSVGELAKVILSTVSDKKNSLRARLFVLGERTQNRPRFVSVYNISLSLATNVLCFLILIITTFCSLFSYCFINANTNQPKMAKSLRSKRKRKVRAEKRIVNAKKELVKLREVAAKLHGQKGQITKQTLEANIPHVQVSETPMETDTELSKSKGTRINTQWMNQKKIKAIKSKIKKHNTKKSRRGGSAGLKSPKTTKRTKR